MNRHLGTAHELTWFAMNMAEQLEAHEKEKIPLRDVPLDIVKKLVVDELKVRTNIICCISLETDHIIRQKEIEKQCVHIANFAMMLFLRSKYNV